MYKATQLLSSLRRGLLPRAHLPPCTPRPLALHPFTTRSGALCRADILVHSLHGPIQRSPCSFLSYPLFLAPLHQTLTFSISRVPLPETGPVLKSLFAGSWYSRSTENA